MAHARQSSTDSDPITDAEFLKRLEEFGDINASEQDITELLKIMNESKLISWDEAERILSETGTKIVKSGLPDTKRPDEPENATDISECIRQARENDPLLVEINLNNLKRIPYPEIQKLIVALMDNSHVKKLNMSNLGLYDFALQGLLDLLRQNATIQCLGLETNFLSGNFVIEMFKALGENNSLEELRLTNQGSNLSNQNEMDLVKLIKKCTSIRKLGLEFRRHEVRQAIDQAIYNNNELKRIRRLAEKAAEEEAKLAPGPAPSNDGARKQSADAIEKPFKINRMERKKSIKETEAKKVFKK